ncbi:unnamed protein product [Hapterophycus canaliculatus]
MDCYTRGFWSLPLVSRFCSRNFRRRTSGDVPGFTAKARPYYLLEKQIDQSRAASKSSVLAAETSTLRRGMYGQAMGLSGEPRYHISCCWGGRSSRPHRTRLSTCLECLGSKCTERDRAMMLKNLQISVPLGRTTTKGAIYSRNDGREE